MTGGLINWLRVVGSVLLYQDVVLGWDSHCHDDVIPWKRFHITDTLWGETTGHQWISLAHSPKMGIFVIFCVLTRISCWKNSFTCWGDLRRSCDVNCNHYNDVIMNTMASQITSLAIVYSTVYSASDQRKYQNSASLVFVRGIHRGPVNSPHKGPVTRKMSPFDDVIMWMVFVPVVSMVTGENTGDCALSIFPVDGLVPLDARVWVGTVLINIGLAHPCRHIKDWEK